MDEPLVSSTFELKKRLLERARNGESRYSEAEMIAMIMARIKNAREIPPDHAKALDKVRGVYEPRSIMALNAIEEALGTGRRFTAAPAEFLAMPVDGGTIN